MKAFYNVNASDKILIEDYTVNIRLKKEGV